MKGEMCMKNIVLIGGDARSLEVIQTLSSSGCKLSVIGFDTYDTLPEQVTALPGSTTDFSKYDVIILPVDGVGASGEVNCPYNSETFTLTKSMLTTAKHCRIFSGITGNYLKKHTAPGQVETIFTRDDVAIHNSIPTAEATLNIAIEHTDTTIHGTPVAVLGFGRVGKTVARLFQQVGADVTALMRSNEEAAKSTVMDMKNAHTDELTERISDFQIVINTVPHLLLGEAVLAEMAPGTLVIDLASKPGGTDFEAAEKLGIQAIHALGLPGKTAPKTAGQILADTIMKMLDE